MVSRPEIGRASLGVVGRIDIAERSDDDPVRPFLKKNGILNLLRQSNQGPGLGRPLRRHRGYWLRAERKRDADRSPS